jgi:hypothetical protein
MRASPVCAQPNRIEPPKAPIMARLSQIGDKAGSRKRCRVCKAALKAAARHTSAR